jgi:hypothetical protein
MRFNLAVLFVTTTYCAKSKAPYTRLISPEGSSYTYSIVETPTKKKDVTIEGDDCTLTFHVEATCASPSDGTTSNPCLDTLIRDGFHKKDLDGKTWQEITAIHFHDSPKYICIKQGGNQFATYVGPTPKTYLFFGFGRRNLQKNQVCRLIAKKYDEVVPKVCAKSVSQAEENIAQVIVECVLNSEPGKTFTDCMPEEDTKYAAKGMTGLKELRNCLNKTSFYPGTPLDQCVLNAQNFYRYSRFKSSDVERLLCLGAQILLNKREQQEAFIACSAKSP